jgi:hypothetical protein
LHRYFIRRRFSRGVELPGTISMQKFLALFLVLLATVPSSSALAQGTEDFVTFRISQVSKKPIEGGQQFVWLATHDSKQGKAQFLISMDIKRTSGGSPFSFSKGTIERVSGSKPTEFLRLLARALAANKPHFSKPSLKQLPFSMAVLGANQSHEIGGSFSDRPPGSWIATKIFLANDQAEVYLNIDPVNGVGEFSMKDEEYGNTLIEELSKVP